MIGCGHLVVDYKNLIHIKLFKQEKLQMPWVWEAAIGEELAREREPHNARDCYIDNYFVLTFCTLL